MPTWGRTPPTATLHTRWASSLGILQSVASNRASSKLRGAVRSGSSHSLGGFTAGPMICSGPQLSTAERKAAMTHADSSVLPVHDNCLGQAENLVAVCAYAGAVGVGQHSDRPFPVWHQANEGGNSRGRIPVMRAAAPCGRRGGWEGRPARASVLGAFCAQIYRETSAQDASWQRMLVCGVVYLATQDYSGLLALMR